MPEWWPSGFAQLQWNFSFGLPALATVWIAWLTLKVLRATKVIQEKQIELIQNQNTLVEKQTQASTALATIATESRNKEAYQTKRLLIKHVLKEARCVAITKDRKESPESSDFIEMNLPVYFNEFGPEQKNLINKVTDLYQQYLGVKIDLDDGLDVIENGKKIEKLAAEVKAIYPDLLELSYYQL